MYFAFSLLALLPIAFFVVGPLGKDSFSLTGPAGPVLAFSAGVLSFASPCVLPLVPIYITHLSGASVERGRIVAGRRALRPRRRTRARLVPLRRLPAPALAFAHVRAADRQGAESGLRPLGRGR